MAEIVLEEANKSTTAWLILIPLSAFLFFDFIQINMMNSFGPFLLQEYSLSPAQLGLISSLFFYTNLILLYPAGVLLDAYSPKWLVIGSIIITCIGILTFIAHPNKTTMIAWRALAGVGGAFSYLSCVKILASFFPRKILGLFLGLTGIVIMSAGVAAQLPLIILLHHYGVINTLWIDLALAAVIIVLLLTMIKDKYSHARKAKLSFAISTAHLSLKNWIIALYAAFTNFPLFVLGALWGDLYLKNVHGFHLAMAAFISSMIFVGNMFGAPILGSISDRLKSRTGLMLFSAVLFFASILAIMLTPANSSHILYLILFFILGFSTGSQTLAYAAVVDINASENAAKATSLLSILSVGGGAIAQALFGWVVDQGGQHYQNGMAILLVAAIVAAGLALLLIHRLKARQMVFI